MSSPTLTIDLAAVVANWRALDVLTTCETGAVVKADAYGLGMERVALALATAGVRQFFVAQTHEGVRLRKILGPGPPILVFGGHMVGDAGQLRAHGLTPMLNSVDQMLRHVESLPGHRFGIQLDTGMNRLGMEPAEWVALRDIAVGQNPVLIMTHLACGDEPDHVMNRQQLNVFKELTSDIDVPLSLSATAGILLGADFHFSLTRPGIGLYGGLPFSEAHSVVTLDLPVVQIRELEVGETVGYGNTWVALRPSRVASLGAGYADGLIRQMGGKAQVFTEGVSCPLIGRVSMDLLTADVTDIEGDPTFMSILCAEQSIDDLACAAGTIGDETLTSLGSRYARMYRE